MKIRRSDPYGLTATTVLTVVVWLACLWAVSGAMAAEPEPSPTPAEPIRIKADHLVSDSHSNSAEFSGSVEVIQANTTIQSDRLKVTYKDGNISQPGVNAGTIDAIEAYGNVRIEFDNRVAVGQKAVYTTIDRKLVLTGPGAKFTHGLDVVEGSVITYYRDNGKVEIDGPVNMIIRSEQRGLN